MKNILETVSVGLVILLSLGLVGLVISYNTVDKTESSMQMDEQVLRSLQSNEVPETKEKQVSNYLDKLEAYKDVDVKVDPTAEPSNVNVATVETEIKKDGAIGNIGNVVQTTEKNENYVQNLENYNPVQPSTDAKIAQSKENTEDETDVTVDETSMKEDPMSDIVNDIDSIIDASEKAK